MVTTAAIVVALTTVRPLCSWSLLAQKIDGKSCTVGLAAFLVWICSEEKREQAHRRFGLGGERSAQFQQGKNIVYSSPRCQIWQGNNYRGFPAPKAETDLPWWRGGRREGLNDLLSFVLSVVTGVPWITWQVAMGAPPPHYSPNMNDAAAPQIYPDHLNITKKHRNICMMALLCSVFAPS